MDQPLPDWIAAARLPGDLYELLGRPRFDPDTDGLQELMTVAYRRWRPYRNHPRPDLARRADDLLRQLGRARVVFGDPAKHAAYDRELVRSSTAGDHRPSSPAAPTRLTGALGVPPDRLESLLTALRPPDPADAAPAGASVPTGTTPVTDRPGDRWIAIKLSRWEERIETVARLLRGGRNDNVFVPVLAVALIATLLLAARWDGAPTPRDPDRLDSVSESRRPTSTPPEVSLVQDGRTTTPSRVDSASQADHPPPGPARRDERKVAGRADRDSADRIRTDSPPASEDQTAKLTDGAPFQSTPARPEPGPIPDRRRTASGRADGVLTLTGHTQDVLDSEFSPDGRLLASASRDGTVKLWDAGTGRELLTLTDRGAAVLSVSFHPGGRLLASASEDGTLKIWGVDTGKALMTLKGHEEAVRFVAFRSDGRRLFSVGDDATVRMWDTSSGGEFASQRRSFHAGSLVVLGLDGRIAAVADPQGQIQVRFSGTRALPLVLGEPAGHVHSMVFSPDGRYLASASSDAVVCVWEPASADQVSRFDNRTSGARCVAFSPGGRYLAVADDDGGVLHSDRWTGEQVPSPARHEGPALGVTFSPDGRRLASTGRDGTVRIWDVPLPADPAPALGYDQADRPERRIAPEMPSFEMDWFSMPPFDPPTPRPGPGPRSRGVAPARSRAAAPLDILGFMRAIRDRAPRTRP